jgi:hypothetical protein
MRGVVTWLALVLTAGGLTACGQLQTSPSRTFKRSDARLYVLAQTDLGRGYRFGNQTVCGGMSPEEETKAFTDFVLETRPGVCRVEINYVWGGARATVVPRAVTSGNVVFDTEDDARRGMTHRSRLLRFVSGHTPREFVELPDFGHEALLFRAAHDTGAGVLWRNENMLSVVYAPGSGVDAPKAPRVAVELARKQQSRIDNPNPPPPTADDPEQPLDDPALDTPIYWLGREFHPSGLPALKLSMARAYPGSGGVLGFTAELDYGPRARTTWGAKLLVFQPTAFADFEKSVVGRVVRGSPCASATKIRLPEGHVIIWGGFTKPTRPPCPDKPYDRYFGQVYLNGAVVTINNPMCLYPCQIISNEAGDPYNAPRGLEAIARALRPRPAPTAS